jgi:hypothetical protein
MPWSESQHLRVWHPHWDVASTFLNIQRVICPLADDLCTGYDALHVCLVLARVSETTFCLDQSLVYPNINVSVGFLPAREAALAVLT